MITKKRKVLLAAQRLFIEKGFRSTSVHDIIEEAKISKGTFYNYFSSKNECIIAIIENAKEETLIKRRELHTQHNVSNVNILIEQMSIRMNIYREYNLFPLFASIIHSQDVELRDLIKKNYFEEINWLSKRLEDVFGDQTKDVAIDCAVLALGMIQQLQHPWIKLDDISFEQLIKFVLRRIESIIYEMATTNDSLLKQSYFEIQTEDTLITKQQVIDELETFYLEHKNNLQKNEQQAIEFILEELPKEKPRIFLLERIIPVLSEAFTESTFEKKTYSILNNLWELIDSWGVEKS
ncbi:TetR/AcrR family transcriptional regulator [Psychrobacillus glaciei]|uniref:TetR/AcrR family transcriptional regulator n=1 Tax=Psychrobacillus glaciei TaxID=2283160 RepID=A0A5J6SPY0_9BACI|nr:TetR/AcrR family transcriptional regulator [Psychrobacillus glaciei]QFF98834.1 TetR/AcrR family transcriptional regulator [Psychrobacillus glaciei]